MLLFFVSASRLFFMLKRFPIESKGRRKKLHEVWCISFLLDFCNLESIYHITKHDCCYTMYRGFCLFSYLHTLFACYPLDFSSHHTVLKSLWWIWNHPSHMITYFKDFWECGCDCFSKCFSLGNILKWCLFFLKKYIIFYISTLKWSENIKKNINLKQRKK